MIEVNHLVKKYGDQYALNDLNFTVEDGKIYGLLGPNGAGKSTCMNIMTGYIAATEGTVLINGHDILKEAEEAKKNIGYLPEIPPLYPDMKVKEYLQFVAELKKVNKQERSEQIDEVMEKTFISDVQNKLIKNLSKGYKQRVGLAQAMLGKPAVIILDEPTVGLDPKQILEIRELILSLKKEHTIILSSHILSEVSAVCDEIMIISKGKMVACDTPEGLGHLMQGEDVLDMEVKGDEMAIRKALAGIEGIRSFISDTAGNGRVNVSVTVEKGFDVREAVFYAMAECKSPIYKLELNRKSLEDIFLELTSGNQTMEGTEETEGTEGTEEVEEAEETGLNEEMNVAVDVEINDKMKEEE